MPEGMCSLRSGKVAAGVGAYVEAGGLSMYRADTRSEF